ncbi:FAD-binding and (Fe-S)-binding domain-containing protein [Neisseria sp. Ec49-e6-T10]|uniref:FAD-binding and (Fe-S)-binding domain-containing protein n=1 Tax=Neisseria sp. Ec49-e6-T10 TaxID=3140744 RepID=UPI003EBEE57A
MMDINDISPEHIAFKNSLVAYLPEKQIYTDPLSRYAYGTDASFYRYIPQVVVRAHNETEVMQIMRLAQQHKVAVTFRASGTSLSGQTCSESVLVLLGDGFLDAQILDDGNRIKLKPMVIGAHANQLLAPLGRKIGPDPASINTARIGGIAANNSSGMCCGTKENSYHTLSAMRVILPDVTILDTSDAQSIASFKQTHALLLNQLKALSERIKNNPELEQKVRYKYRMKNTTGYGINALIDFDDPIDMLIHLMIGSEGTLGFISEVVYNTVFDYPHKASALIFFDSLDKCCRAVTALRQRATVDAVELLDGPSIRCVGQAKQGLPEFFYSDCSNDSACLLIETKAPDDETLNTQIDLVNQIVSEFDYKEHSQFSKDTKVTDMYWSVRKGLLPIVAGGRPKGSNVLTEDVVFPIESLADGVRTLTQMFQKHGYTEGMVMGHALEGNLHFVLTPSVETTEEIERYNTFMQELAHKVTVQYNGSLKGEHGTGRNIAPFVRVEWGDDAYQIMCDLKTLFDPDNILNPDVIISSNERLHLQSFKSMPVADELIDDCMECGFCEPACPSDGLSLTPRQRITVYRRMAQLKQASVSNDELAYYEEHFSYQGIDTCAATGMCATRCPVSVNTGALIKKIKPKAKYNRILAFAENNIRLMSSSARLGVRAVHLFGNERVNGWTKKLHNQFKFIPIVPENLPYPASKAPIRDYHSGAEPVVYFISCVNRTLAEENINHSSVAQHTVNLFHKTGFKPIFPNNMNSLCCGQPFESAGSNVNADRATVSLNQALLDASDDGLYPIYLDNAPCALRVKEAQEKGLIDQRLKIYDAASFLAQQVMPKLNISYKLPELAVHIPCSASKMGVRKELLDLANACANKVNVPDIACCGFAGSKGFSYPELNQNGLRHLKEVLPKSCQHGVSMSKTCQIGLTTHSGMNYQSIEALLDQCSQ